MTKAVPFTQASAERAIRAVRKMGLHVTGLSLLPGGALKLELSEEKPRQPLPAGPRPRDAREKFGGRHGTG